MLKKKPVSKNATCEVTFILSTRLDANSVAVVGDFNSWDANDGLQMHKNKEGHWEATITLEAEREFQYRYLIDGNDWLNDEEADKFEAHPYGGQNSVVVT
jgi:1,4-alpha-glucan branching enzyme